MRIQINQTISNILDEDRNPIRSNTSETLILFPDEGKKLKNIKTGLVIDGYIAIGSKGDKDNYIEVEGE